jgi:hypothetical protein
MSLHVGSLHTYDSRFSQPKKNLALTSSKKDKKVVGVESSEEDSSDSEVMSMLTRKFHRHLKNSKGSSRTFSLEFFKSSSCGGTLVKNSRDGKDKKSLGVQCFNYLGYGHVSADYCNLNNSKDNAMDASLSD